jgi:apolipoprotein N-acyltransferase
MRLVGLLVILLGLAGALAFSKAELRWESAGAAVVGLVLILTAKIDSPRR